MTDNVSSTDKTQANDDPNDAPNDAVVAEEATPDEQEPVADAPSEDPNENEQDAPEQSEESVGEDSDEESADEESADEESADEESAVEEPAPTENEVAEEPEPAAEDEDEEPEEAEPEEEPEPVEPPSKMRWYCVKVQSGREDTIKKALERRTKIEGLEEFVGQIIVPEERVPEIRKGKRIERRHKLYPGYLMVEVEYNDRVLYLFRETTGVGDFVGGSVTTDPSPMSDQEVERMLSRHQGGPRPDDKTPARPITKSPYSKGDRLRIRDGTFAGMEAEVVDVVEERSIVRLEVTIIGRTVEVDLEYWQVEPV